MLGRSAHRIELRLLNAIAFSDNYVSPNPICGVLDARLNDLCRPRSLRSVTHIPSVSCVLQILDVERGMPSLDPLNVLSHLFLDVDRSSSLLLSGRPLAIPPRVATLSNRHPQT